MVRFRSRMLQVEFVLWYMPKRARCFHAKAQQRNNKFQLGPTMCYLSASEPLLQSSWRRLGRVQLGGHFDQATRENASTGGTRGKSDPRTGCTSATR